MKTYQQTVENVYQPVDKAILAAGTASKFERIRQNQEPSVVDKPLSSGDLSQGLWGKLLTGK
jgi:hypothetical protein